MSSVNFLFGDFDHAGEGIAHSIDFLICWGDKRIFKGSRASTKVRSEPAFIIPGMRIANLQRPSSDSRVRYKSKPGDRQLLGFFRRHIMGVLESVHLGFSIIIELPAWHVKRDDPIPLKRPKKCIG
jgi:hypothetical protein